MIKQGLTQLLEFGKVTKFNQLRANNPEFEIDLSGADLAYANLRGADLSGADLCGAIFRGAIFRGANLKDAKFRDAILEGADLRGAILQGIYMPKVDLSGAIFDKEQIAMLPELLGIKIIED